MVPVLDENRIHALATEASYEKGRTYFEKGAVLDVVRRSGVVTARVAGSGRDYRVRIDHVDEEDIETDCSCPYEGNGACKHIVAALLTTVKNPGSIEERLGLDDLLEGLDGPVLRDVIRRIVGDNDNLLQQVEAAVHVLGGKSGSGAHSRRMCGATAEQVGRRLERVLHRFNRMRRFETDWHVDEELESARSVLDDVEKEIRLEVDECHLRALAAFTQTYSDEWTMLDGSDGWTGMSWDDIGKAWTRAMILAGRKGIDLDPWKKEIMAWRSEMEDYDEEEVFDEPLHVCEVLSTAGDPRFVPPEQAGLWIEVLEWAGEHEDALVLARRTQDHAATARLLVESREHEAAAQLALESPLTPDERLGVAKRFWEYEEIRWALAVAKAGLKDEEDGAESLAAWLADRAKEAGETRLARRAARRAFELGPTFTGYMRLMALYDKQEWPRIRKEVLARLESDDKILPGHHVSILLEEKQVNKAVAVADSHSHIVNLVGPVEAALKEGTCLQWAADRSLEKAQRIMDARDARRYNEAARWLARCRRAHEQQDRLQNWRDLHTVLLRRHARQHKLVPMIRELG